jgi:hypothetical protein
LGDDAQLGGHASLIGQSHARFCQLDLGRAGEQVHQVEGHLQASFSPVLVDQVAVGVVLEAVIEAQVRKQTDQGAAGFIARNAGVVVLLAQVCVLLQRQFFELADGDVHGMGRNIFKLGLLYLDERADRCIDERGQIHHGGGEFLLNRLQQPHVF